MQFRARTTVNPVLRTKTWSQAFDLDRRDMKTLSGRMDTAFRAHETRNFATEGAHGGRRWAGLSPEYAKRKRRAVGTKKILQWSGKLRKSLTQTGGDHLVGFTVKPKATVVLGTNNALAAYHGPTSVHNPRLPVRDAIQHEPAQERRYLELAHQFFVEEKLPRLMRAMLAGQKRMRGTA